LWAGVKTVVCVDGLNLYYGVLRGTGFKWLDLYGLFQEHVLGAATCVEKVRYYTAPLKRSASDDPASRQRLSMSALFDGLLSKPFDGVPVPVPTRCIGLRESEPGNEFGRQYVLTDGK
jgi:hypothetical protein